MSVKGYILIHILLLTFGSSSKYSIHGYIKNKYSKDPIENVNVYVKDLKIGSVSGANGFFKINLEKKISQVYMEFSHVAFETVRWKGDPSETIYIETKETFLKLDEILITGTISEFSSSDTPVFTEIINNADIRSSNAFTLGELIEDRAGVCKMYNFDGSFDYNIFGLDSKYILIMKDGQPVTGKFADKIDLDQIFLTNVEKIEILKGPGSALYGTEAMGGVINIISKRATAKYTGEIRFKNENFDGISSKILENPYAHNISYNISMPILFFRLDLSGAYQMLLQGKNFTIAGKDEISKTNFDLGLYWYSQNKKHVVRTGYLSFARSDTSNTLSTTSLLVKSNSTNITRNEILVSHDFSISENIALTQKFNINNYKRIFRQNGIDESFYRYFNTNEKLSDYEIKLNLDFEKITMVGGFEFSKPTFKNDRVQGKTFNRETRSIYLQNNFRYSDKHKVVTGFRYDRYGSNHVYSPRFAYLFQISKEMKFRISAGTGFRIPSFLELYIDFYNVENGYIVKGNNSLKPERSIGTSVNLEYVSKKFRMNALAYQNRFRDKIFSTYKDTSSPIIFYEYQNIAKANFQGVELFLDYLANSATTVKLNVNIRKTTDGDGNPTENVIPYSAATRLTRIIPNRSLKISIQSTFNFLENKERSFIVHNIKTTRRIYESLHIACGVENISNIINDRSGPFIGRSVFLELVKILGN